MRNWELIYIFVSLKPNKMKLSFSQETYTQALQVQIAQIQALQCKVAELEAKLEVAEQANQIYI